MASCNFIFVPGNDQLFLNITISGFYAFENARWIIIYFQDFDYSFELQTMINGLFWEFIEWSVKQNF